MIYGSICSGIEAATVAWHPLGWRPAFFAEIDAAPSRILAYHYPEVTNHGDFTAIPEPTGPVDLLVGGTPCQSFSIAGKRLGLDDPRGNLAIEFVRLACRLRARWILWENVPGVLSSNGGEDFKAFLETLADGGYQCAWRVLDAQFFGVPQRRRRVFVVGYSGDWRPAAAVLFEPESVCRDTEARVKAGQAVAALTARGVGTCGADDNQAQAGHLIAHTLRGEGHDASEDGTGRGAPLVARCLNAGANGRQDFETETLVPGFATFDERNVTSAVNRTRCEVGLPANTLHAQGLGLITPSAVRRLTERECERLQGFPDDYTAVPKVSASARYKALGNSMAVPVMRWIGERIATLDRAKEAQTR